jgi:hypothetical protein
MTSFADDPSIVKLSGSTMPGSVISIKGAERGFEWDVQKGTASSGAATIFKGAKIAEKIEIVTKIVSQEEADSIDAFRAYIAPAKIGGKPPTFTIENSLVNFNKIGRVSISIIGQPEVTPGLGRTVAWTFIEYQPPAPAKTGPADPAKGGGAGSKAGSPDADIAALQKQRDALAAEYAKA